MLHKTISLKESFPFLGENGCDPKLTLYLHEKHPELKRKTEKLPCLLICPGGGYGFVSAREAEPIVLNFLPKGFQIFVLTYSVAPHKYPTQLRQVAAAMEVIYANADAWDCDTNRIGIMGFSAGGHLACHYSNCYDCADVRAVFPDSKGVNAAVLSYPVISADPRWRHTGSFQNLAGEQEVSQETIERFSLHTKVTDRTPPTFLWHTAQDQLVHVMNTLLYAQALAQHNVPFSVRIYPRGLHGLATADDQTCADWAEVPDVHQWMEEAAQWLLETM